jgi:hypothetical protein
MSEWDLSKYPQVEPPISIEKLPPEEIALEIKGAPSCFFKFEVGDRFLWLDYDYPETRLTQVYRCEVAGKMLFQGEECFEVRSHFHDLRNGKRETSYSYYALREDEMASVLSISWEPGKTGEIEFYNWSVPRFIKTGDKWQSIEESGQGEAKRITHHIEEVDGPYLVKVGDREAKCLRWISARDPRTEKRLLLAEIFISIETGLGFLFRRYNGRGWDNLDKLKNCPKILYEGETYLLWYDCLIFRD